MTDKPVSPGIGGPTTGTACAYRPANDESIPLCGADPAIHVVGMPTFLRVVDLFACADHVRNAQLATTIIAEHPYTSACEGGGCRSDA